jgi:hypothetical protein
VLVPVLGKHKNRSETGAPDREPRHFRLNHGPEPSVVLQELAPRAINNHPNMRGRGMHDRWSRRGRLCRHRVQVVKHLQKTVSDGDSGRSLER